VLVSKGNNPVVLHHATAPATLEKAVSIELNTTSATASGKTDFVMLSPDDKTITIGGLHLGAHDALSVAYTVKVLNEGVNAPAIGSLISTGTAFAGTASSLHTWKGFPNVIPILVTGKFKYAVDVKALPAQCTPVSSAQASGIGLVLDNLYHLQPTILPEHPAADAQHSPTPVPGDERFIVHYANTSGSPAAPSSRKSRRSSPRALAMWWRKAPALQPHAQTDLAGRER
jgi:hypothetical protein